MTCEGLFGNIFCFCLVDNADIFLFSADRQPTCEEGYRTADRDAPIVVNGLAEGARQKRRNACAGDGSGASRSRDYRDKGEIASPQSRMFFRSITSE